MINHQQKTLLDNIFLGDFQLYQSESQHLTYVHSDVIDSQKANRFGVQIAFPISLFKEHPFYFMIDPVNEKLNDSQLKNIAESLLHNINRFIHDTTLKKAFPHVGAKKIIDFSKLSYQEPILGYHIEAQYRDSETTLFFSFFIPRKTLNQLIALISKKNIAKIENVEQLTTFIKGMRSEFSRRNIKFPLNVEDFFNDLLNQDLQKIVGLLLTNNLMSYDMLRALSTKMDEGFTRIMENLSKNQKKDFTEICTRSKGDDDFRWVEIALYQIGLSLDQLLKERKFESIQIERVKKLLNEILVMELSHFFEQNSFDSMIQQVDKLGLLQNLMLHSNDLTLARSLISLEEKSFNIIKKNISKRKLQYLLEDITYQKKNCSKINEIESQYELFKLFTDLNFKKFPEEYKVLEKWFPRFATIKDFNFAVDYVGAIEFSLALLSLPVMLKKWVVKNLKPPLKYFISYFLSNKIKLGFPYGELRIKEATKEVVRLFYQLEQEQKIKFKPFEKQESETTQSSLFV